MIHDYWIYVIPWLALNYPCKSTKSFMKGFLVICAHVCQKQIPMQEWIWIKCPHISHVEGDRFLHSQRAWACRDMVARDSQMYTSSNQMNWQFVQILKNFKFRSKLGVLDTDDVQQKTSLFSVQEKSVGIVSWLLFLCFTSSVSGTQNECQNSHHSHPLHPLRIYGMNLSWM